MFSVSFTYTEKKKSDSDSQEYRESDSWGQEQLIAEGLEDSLS